MISQSSIPTIGVTGPFTIISDPRGAILSGCLAKQQRA